MSVHEINPLNDSRWNRLVSEHPSATVFHDPRWLEALRATYGYEPIVFTTSCASGALENGWVFCQVESWLTGRRLVSLPFSDHCDPLVNCTEELDEIADFLQQQRRKKEWKYVEARPLAVELASKTFQPCSSYFAQQLHLAPSTQQLFAGLHKDSIQRKIRRAEREGIVVEEERSGAFLKDFYCLQSMTRRRHRLPPQPREWFRNVVGCFGDSCSIYVATLGDRPIAAILTLRFRKQLVYKYGASDARSHSLGAMPLLFWRIIQQAKDEGREQLDLGRSDLGNLGLIKFKEHLGASGHQIHYMRQGSPYPQVIARVLANRVIDGLCSFMPACVMNAAGKVLYRHIG